ncbi:sensor histidine kinase [Afipia sp. TerB]
MTLDAMRRRAIWQVALLVAGLLVLLVISAASIFMVERTRTDSAWAIHSAEVENQISLAQLQMRRAESAIRGYALTGETNYRTDFAEADKQIGPTLESLRRLTIDNPLQQRAVERMIPLTNQRFEEFRSVANLIGDGKIEEARQVIKTNSGRDQMSRIRDIATEMRTEEGRLFRARTEAADDSQSLAAVVTTTGAGLVIVLAGLSMFLVRRSSQVRMQAEQQLRDININLEAAVEERTADLREANEEIQRFAYIVSHDLRSPLVNIMGFTSELDELRSDIFGRIARYSRAAAALPEPPPATGDEDEALSEEDKRLSQEFSESLDFIKSSIGKMDRLIGAILNLTREGRREFNPVKIDTRELVESIISATAHQIVEAEAKIRVEPLPDLVTDRLALEQIFSNLIENALKYLKPGVPGDIAISGRNKLGFVIFDITDNGRGIDPKDHQRIFDLFRRAGTQDKPGQGIGLAHVRALVRRMGGTINVSSELDKGSTFTIALPAKWTMSRQGKHDG